MLNKHLLNEKFSGQTIKPAPPNHHGVITSKSPILLMLNPTFIKKWSKGKGVGKVGWIWFLK